MLENIHSKYGVARGALWLQYSTTDISLFQVYCMHCTCSDSLPVVTFCYIDHLYLPPLSRCQRAAEDSHTFLSSCRESKGSSCHHRRETGGQPFHRGDNQGTRCPNESCNHFHGFSLETCSRVFPLKGWGGGEEGGVEKGQGGKGVEREEGQRTKRVRQSIALRSTG